MRKSEQNKKKNKWLFSVLFGMYLLVLGYFLFLSEEMGRKACLEYKYNFVPFKEIMRYLNHHRTVGLWRVFLNIGGNILAFIPFGFLFPKIWNFGKKGFGKTILFGFLCVCIIEGGQLFTRVGSCDIDDVILNTLGIVLGSFIYFGTTKEGGN